VSALLEIDRLAVRLPVGSALRPVIHDVSLTVAAGEALGLVGESGSGKSMTLRAITRLLPPGAEVGGDVRFGGRSVGALGRRDLRAFRAHDIAVVFQDPRAHINPMRSIGDFLCEALTTTRGVGAAEARRRVTALLRDVGIADAPRRLRQRPYELSGGLLQRVMIAAALAAQPRMILADEPTTALDVTTQEEVMAILDELRRERGLAMLFVTHDLELASAVCDRIAVMYAGAIVEDRPAAELHRRTAHPYTAALLAARPGLGARGERLRTVAGRPLSAFEAPAGCAFAPRCPRAEDRCRRERPVLWPVAGGRAACHLAEEVAAAPATEVLDA
jgi:oligopeptide/dipeptide ABC transporter ATP-binding protein